MAIRQSVIQGLRLLGNRDFWSFKVVHALFGGLLTLSGAAGALFVGGELQKRIVEVDNRIATATSRIASIGSTLLQFRVVQSNGVLLGALSSGDAVRPEYRESFIQLMFVLRRGPALSILGELYLEDPVAFGRERDELDRRVAAATAPERTKQSWDAVLEFEMTRERQLMDLQDSFRARSLELQGEKRELSAALDRSTFIGFVVQQLGFVVVLLAGLLYQHAEGRAPRRPIQEPA
jgi:hypothetical protein